MFRFMFEHLVLRTLSHILDEQEDQGELIMTLKDDLAAAVATMEEGQARNHTDILAVIEALNASQHANDPAIQDAIARLQAVAGNLKTDDDAVEGALTPPASKA